jgi:Mannosyl-glycoprotein endo-beta-N-acetylglucosaminidase
MGVSMMCHVRALSALALVSAVSAAALSPPANAASLPAIKLSDANTVPACATPGRLSAFLEKRNSKLDERFGTIAADYMRIGEELKIRWDTAFFQMLLETGNLTFTGDVSAKQNNFAGLGATGKHEPGESFPDVATGVKAHLEHLLMYSGEKLDNPVAERTRKVQEWAVLTSWQKTIEGPMTFTQLAKKWAPSTRSYSSDIGNVSDAFYDGLCKADDPKPEMMALAKPDEAASKAAPDKATKVAAAPAASDEGYTPPKISGADLARRANEEARTSGSYVRSNLGAGLLANLGEAAKSADASSDSVVNEPAKEMAKTQPAVTILNAAKPEPETAEAAAVALPPAIPAVETSGKVQLAALGSSAKTAVAPPAAVTPPPVSKCKVWTASYGGSRAVIIKASADAQDNYTVLDVNEGTETREADAYISAYAKGGKTVGEFTSTTQALDKAFELCPEG